MVKRLTKFAQVAALGLALTLTFSCSGDDGDEGGGSACPSGSTSLDGVWDMEDGSKITISGSTGKISALPSKSGIPFKVGDQVYKGLTSTGNLTWSGQALGTLEECDDNDNCVVTGTEWNDVTLTMSADGQTLTIGFYDYGYTMTHTRKCSNQSGGGSSSSVKGSSSPSSGNTFKDSRDGKSYKYVKIGEQTWMAENLNYDVPGNDTDVCYGDDPDYCKKYGRLYDWETANVACPNGWKLPLKEEWQELVDLAGGNYSAGKKLKAKSGWYIEEDPAGNGEDTFGFAALPGGYCAGICNGVRESGNWWTATEHESNSNYAYSRFMASGSIFEEDVRNDNPLKKVLISVRCIKDN